MPSKADLMVRSAPRARLEASRVLMQLFLFKFIVALRPKFARGEARAFGEARELCPYDAGVDCGLAHPGAVAAIAPGDDVLAADQPGIAADALGDQLRVLNKVGL